MSSRRLTHSQVTEIRKRYAQGEKQHPLAREFGVAQSQISMIVHNKARTEESRPCLDCNVPISLSRRRCVPCQRKYKFVYWQKWYESRRAVTTRRYRTEQGGFVVDKHTNEVHGPFTYNHARYLTAKWNRNGIAI